MFNEWSSCKVTFSETNIQFLGSELKSVLLPVAGFHTVNTVKVNKYVKQAVTSRISRTKYMKYKCIIK